MRHVGFVSFALVLSLAENAMGHLTGNRHLQALIASAGSNAIPANATCTIEDSVDYGGKTMGSMHATNAEDCCIKCHDTPYCNAFSWSDYEGGTCWFKTEKGNAKPKQGVRSAQVAPGPIPQDSSPAVCRIRANIDFIGNDIGHFHAKEPEMCCDICQHTAECGAFSWSNYLNGECWLKGFKGDSKPSLGVKSAVVEPLNPPPQSACSLEVGVDYVGNDLHSLNGQVSGFTTSNGVWDCCKQCAVVPGCKAYTWTSDKGGTCWLKSGKNQTRVSSGAVSGVFNGPVATFPLDAGGDNDPMQWQQQHHNRHIQYKIREGKIPVRATNLGGWFVGEYWMTFTSPMWEGAWGVEGGGEYVAMKTIGHDDGDKQFENHRQTWVTEKDIAEIAGSGLNTVRVPVGFWIVDDDPSAKSSEISRVYAPGGLKYLDRLINVWCAKHNIAVILSLHSHQGSQNGMDHSAPQVPGKSLWGDSDANFNSSVQFATVLAHRYKNSPAFLGIGLMNEPTAPSYEKLQAYYEEAYKRIRADGNDCILTVAPHLYEQQLPVFNDFMTAPKYTHVWVEWHSYFAWGYEGLEEDEIIAAVKHYGDTFNNRTGNPIFLGEWSLATAEAAQFKDRTKFKEFAQVQMDTLARAQSGWSFWSWKNSQESISLSRWSMRKLIREGIITVPKDAWSNGSSA